MATEGMPRFVPTDEQRKQVETLAGYGIPHEQICRLIISPRTKRAIDAKTLRLAFRDELDVGHVKANSAVVQSLYQQATGGNVSAAIWWTKVRMGWKETLLHGQDPENPLNAVTDADRLQVMLSVFHENPKLLDEFMKLLK